MQPPAAPGQLKTLHHKSYTMCARAPAALLADDGALALGAHHDAVARKLQRGHVDRHIPVARRLKRRHVHQVGEICAGEARRASRNHLQPHKEKGLQVWVAKVLMPCLDPALCRCICVVRAGEARRAARSRLHPRYEGPSHVIMYTYPPSYPTTSRCIDQVGQVYAKIGDWPKMSIPGRHCAAKHQTLCSGQQEGLQPSVAALDRHMIRPCLQVDIGSARHVLEVHLQDLAAPGHIWIGHHDVPVAHSISSESDVHWQPINKY